MPNRGPKETLSIGMFMLAVVTFWEKYSTSASSLSLESMLYDPSSPGRIFLLDETGILEKIYEAPPFFAGKIDWSETAGMRQFTKTSNVSLSKIKEIAIELIREEYKN